MRKWLSLGGSLLFLSMAPGVASLYQSAWKPSGSSPAGISVPELLGGEMGQGFSQPTPGRHFEFPQDHSAHLDYRTEWWYFTGNLGDFGYELTIFRQALLSPLEMLLPRTSQWASANALLGHFAISDVAAGKFYHFQRLSRAALGLAGYRDPQSAPTESRLAWVEDWQIKSLVNGTYELEARDQGCALQLSLTSDKRPVLQGDGGYSRKADQPEQASNYYSLTRLQTQGQITTPRGSQTVSGLSWMDREWSTRPLGTDLSGWDWFALQLEDGQEMMFYQLRDLQGKATRWSAGSWVDQQQTVTPLASDQVKIQVTDWWQSPLDNTRYPAGWDLEVKGKAVRLQVRPRLADQELSGLGRYWEGAVSIEGTDATGRPLRGRGYVELVGYAGGEATRKTRLR